MIRSGGWRMRPQFLQYSSSTVAGSVGVGLSKYSPVTEASSARKKGPNSAFRQAPHTAMDQPRAIQKEALQKEALNMTVISKLTRHFSERLSEPTCSVL